MKVLALIPAYNEERAISSVVRGVFPYMSDVLVIDDGSLDRTAELAKLAGARVIRFPKNCGKGAALKTGFAVADQMDFTHVLTIDADGQHDPAEIPRFTEKAQATGADIVIGCRMGDLTRMPKLRRITNRLSSGLVSLLTGKLIRDSQSGYRLISTRLLRQIPLRASRYDMESEILIAAARMGFMIDEVPIKTIYGEERSKFRNLVDTLRFLRVAILTAIRVPRNQTSPDDRAAV